MHLSISRVLGKIKVTQRPETNSCLAQGLTAAVLNLLSKSSQRNCIRHTNFSSSAAGLSSILLYTRQGVLQKWYQTAKNETRSERTPNASQGLVGLLAQAVDTSKQAYHVSQSFQEIKDLCDAKRLVGCLVARDVSVHAPGLMRALCQ